MASVTHQTAISTVTAATLSPAGAIPAGSGNNKITRNNNGPRNRPITLRCLNKYLPRMSRLPDTTRQLLYQKCTDNECHLLIINPGLLNGNLYI